MPDNTIEQNEEPVISGSEKLSRTTKILYASGSITEVLMGNIVVILAMPIYFLGLGVDAWLITIALAIPRLWDAITDPIVANISDNAHTRFGRRKPFILIGTIFTAVFCILLWMPPVSIGKTGLFFYFLIISMLYYTSYTVFSIPFHALGPELTGDYNERIRLMSYKSFMMGLGGTLFLPGAYELCLKLGKGATDVKPAVAGARIVGIIFGVLMIFFVIFPVLFTKERFASVNKEKISLITAMKCTLKNKPFVMVCMLIVSTMLGSYMVLNMGLFINIGYVFKGDEDKVAKIIKVYGTLYGIVSMASIPLISIISTRCEKKHILSAGLILTLLSYFLSWFLYNPNIPYLQLIHAVIAAPGMACLWLITSVFVADVCDLDELKTGLRREGMYTAVFGWFMKASVAGGTAISGIIITWTGFNREITVQTVETILKLRLTFITIPVAFMILAIYFTNKYSLNREEMERIQVQLIENRKMAEDENVVE